MAIPTEVWTWRSKIFWRNSVPTEFCGPPNLNIAPLPRIQILKRTRLKISSLALWPECLEGLVLIVSGKEDAHGIPSGWNSSGIFTSYFQTSAGIGFKFAEFPRNSKRKNFSNSAVFHAQNCEFLCFSWVAREQVLKCTCANTFTCT